MKIVEKQRRENQREKTNRLKTGGKRTRTIAITYLAEGYDINLNVVFSEFLCELLQLPSKKKKRKKKMIDSVLVKKQKTKLKYMPHDI